MKKFYSLSILILSILFFGGINLTSVAAQSVTIDMPISVVVANATFNTANRQVSVPVVLENNTGNFIDGLTYTLSLYKGDALAKDGYLFAPLTLISTATGTVSQLEPQASTSATFIMVPPKTIDTGKYFIKVSVQNAGRNFYGTDYTKDPITLTGTGGYIGQIYSSFRTSHGDDAPMQGWYVQAGETPSIIIPLSQNVPLNSTLQKKAVFANINVYAVNGDNKDLPVYTYPSVKLSPVVEKGVSLIKIDLAPWSGIVAGPYTVNTTLVDSAGNIIAEPINSRWLEAGFSARLNSVETGTNTYLKGDKIDLQASVASAPDVVAGQQGKIEAVFSDPAISTPITFSKMFTFGGEVTVDFSNLQAGQNFKPTALKVILTDVVSGRILDTYTTAISQKGIYRQAAQAKNSIPVWWYIVLAVIAILLIVFIVLSLKYKKLQHIIVAVIALILFVGLLLVKGQIANASQPSTPGTATISVSGTFPSGTQAYSTMTISNVYFTVTCTECLNQTNLTMNIAGVRYYEGRIGDTASSHAYNTVISNNEDTSQIGPFTVSTSTNNYTISAYTNTAGAGGSNCYYTSYSKSYTVNYLPPPTGLTASCPTPGTTATLSWHAVNGATSYKVRIDDQVNSWLAQNINCTSPINAGDTCKITTATSMSTSTVSTHTYKWWLSAIANGAEGSSTSQQSFTCASNALAVSCSVNPNPAAVNQTVTWTATPAGGAGGYTYLWSGTNINNKTTQIATTSYSTAGTYNASVKVTDSAHASTTISCPASVGSSGGGTDGGGVVINSGTITGACVVGGSYASAPSDPYLCQSGNSGSFVTTGTGWSWNCYGSDSATTTDDALGCSATNSSLGGGGNGGSLSCSIVGPAEATSTNTVPVNTNTTWTLNSAPSTAQYNYNWTVNEGNRSSTSTQNTTTFSKIFSTEGLKSINIYFSSSTAPGNWHCSGNNPATTSVILPGNTNEI